MTLRALNFSGAFEKQAPGRGCCVVFLGKEWELENLILKVILQ